MLFMVFVLFWNFSFLEFIIKMFIETMSYRKVGAMGGIVGSQSGRWAIIGNDGWSYTLTLQNFAKIKFCI